MCPPTPPCPGFHRPLGVIPPSTQPSASPHSRTPPSVYQLPRPKYPHYPAPYHAPAAAPAAYGAHFPSHFYPEKLYQYWHHYYPRIPGTGHKYFLQFQIFFR